VKIRVRIPGTAAYKRPGHHHPICFVSAMEGSLGSTGFNWIFILIFSSPEHTATRLQAYHKLNRVILSGTTEAEHSHHWSIGVVRVLTTDKSGWHLTFAKHKWIGKFSPRRAPSWAPRVESCTYLPTEFRAIDRISRICIFFRVCSFSTQASRTLSQQSRLHTLARKHQAQRQKVGGKRRGEGAKTLGRRAK